MLILTREIGQSICLPDTDATITVRKTSRNRVRLSINAPRDVSIVRGELSSASDDEPDEEIDDGTVVEDDIEKHWCPEPKSRVRGPEHIRILVAINEANDRRRYADGLRREGYCVEESGDGLRCLTRLRSGQFALLVAELRLLWGGGDGVVELMSLDQDIPSIPAVLLSPDDNPPSSHDAANRCPYGAHEMIELVKRRLEVVS